MAKIFMSLGFWMTILLFVALGYAYENAYGAECVGCSACAGTINCGSSNVTRASSISPDENQRFQFENDLAASDDVRRRKCTPSVSPRTNYPDFQQMTNLQAGDAPVYAPGFSFTITRRPPEVALCPGPIEIPRH